VLYLPDAAARERITARLAAAGVEPVAQIDYWQANGGVTYQDPMLSVQQAWDVAAFMISKPHPVATSATASKLE